MAKTNYIDRDDIGAHLGRIQHKKALILAKPPSERTEHELFFLRRFYLYGVPPSGLGISSLDQCNEIAVRVINNALFLVELSDYSARQLKDHLAKHEVLIDLLELRDLFRDGKRLSMNFFIPCALASHFRLPVSDFMFLDLRSPGALPAGYLPLPLK